MEKVFLSRPLAGEARAFLLMMILGDSKCLPVPRTGADCHFGDITAETDLHLFSSFLRQMEARKKADASESAWLDAIKSAGVK